MLYFILGIDELLDDFFYIFELLLGMLGRKFLKKNVEILYIVFFSG